MIKNEAGYTIEDLIGAHGSIDAIPTAAWTFPEGTSMRDLITARGLLARGLPRRYRRSRIGQTYYRQGFTDGFEGRKKPDAGYEEDLKRHQGNAAWRAYEHGFEIGCQEGLTPA